MKSIKEKAEEWADMYPSCGMADKSFTEGANYVLECIEELIPNDEALQNDVRCKSAIFRIQAIIEQLKSNNK